MISDSNLFQANNTPNYIHAFIKISIEIYEKEIEIYFNAYKAKNDGEITYNMFA